MSISIRLILRLFAAVLTLVIGSSQTSAQPTVRFIDPTSTDPAIREVELPNAEGLTHDHLVATDPTATDAGMLLLFFPGTGAAPVQYRTYCEVAASMGYDVIALTYDSHPSINGITLNDPDPTLPEAIRRERLYGEPAPAYLDINVDVPNSAVNRLTKLLEQLIEDYPGERWSRYLRDGEVQWRRIVVSGHSQGGGHAAYLTKEQRLAGAVMLAAPGDVVQGFGPAPWLSREPATPAERMFALVHVDDPAAAAFFNHQRILGLDAFGPIQNVDGQPQSALTSHMLASLTRDGITDFHSAVVADGFFPVDSQGKSIYEPAWRAMLSGPSTVPEEPDFAAVTRFLDDNAAAFAPGMLVIVERDGRELYRHLVGGVITENDVIDIASATKTFSAAAILAMAEAGVLSLDDRIGDTVAVMDQFGKGDFTVREAFSMTSGLTDPPGTNQRYHTDPRYTLAESVNLIAQNTPQLFAPGTVMSYDGKAMQVVGQHAVLSANDGRGWRDLARDYLFAPLGLANTEYNAFGQNPAVAGGITTTATDALTFLRMLSRGGVADDGTRVLGPLLGEFFTYTNDGLPLDANAPLPYEPGPWYPGAVTQPQYGLGSWVMGYDPLTREITQFNGAGAFGATMFLDRERDYYGVLWTRMPLGHGATQLQVEALELIRRAVDHAERRDIAIGPYDRTAFDPEFLSGPHRTVYQDPAGNAWLARIDPHNGFFADGTSPDVEFIDAGLTNLLATNNGPEFGLDANGWSVIYTKPEGGANHTWGAIPLGDGLFDVAPYASGAPPRSGSLASRDPSAESLIIGFRSRGPGGIDTIGWFDDDSPSVTYAAGIFERGQTPIGFMPGNQEVVFSKADSLGTLQLFLLDAEGVNPPHQITFDESNKTYPFPIAAPELDGGALIVAVRDDDTLVCYAQTQQGWSEFAAMTIPANRPYPYLASPEPFVFRGRTFVSLSFEAELTGISDGEIWVFGPDLGAGSELRIRCDDLGPPQLRTDPEFLVTPDEVFIYYNVVRPDGITEVRRCRTGFGDLVGAPGDYNHDGYHDFFDIVTGLRDFDAGEWSADTNHDRVLDAADIVRMIETVEAASDP